ncbi:MAG: hypothetical protein KGQ60_17260, partial [Planctomycetes bacterium]|nr:hypothetical protein [Planctomycetota bacterium]
MAKSKGKRTSRVSRGGVVVAHRVEGGNWSYVATNSDYADVCRHSAIKVSRPTRPRKRAAVRYQKPSSVKRVASRSIVCFSRLADLTDEVVSQLRESQITKQVVFVGGSPVEAVTPRLMALQIRSPDRLHIADKKDSTSEAMLIHRLFAGMREVGQDPTIVDAWVEGDQLVLLSAAFQRLSIPFSKLDRFLGNNRDEGQRFEIDEDGRFLYWPHADVHFGWKQLEQLVDPTKSLQDQKKTDRFKRLYGNAVRKLRESAGLKQTEIDGLTDRQLRRIESGEQMASSKALESLAKAHR